MFSQDSRGGRPRGQSSFGNNWGDYGNEPSYGGNQFRDSPDDFRQQGFGRNQDRQDSGSSEICQNYLQNKCMRGNNCQYRHPPSAGGNSRLPANFSTKRQQNPWLNFCMEFQKGTCPYTDDCRLVLAERRLIVAMYVFFLSFHSQDEILMIAFISG